ITVLNSLGQLVRDYPVETEVSTIDITNLPNGVYFVRVNINNTATKQDKIVKQ
ncbi:MAG: T9SS type A sorting domain-containing protein, partial [Bacteroidia bacterium]|nr:T9SS type A sorting domain-containing protein [Bacteroidia bacterium]